MISTSGRTMQSHRGPGAHVGWAVALVAGLACPLTWHPRQAAQTAGRLRQASGAWWNWPPPAPWFHDSGTEASHRCSESRGAQGLTSPQGLWDGLAVLRCAHTSGHHPARGGAWLSHRGCRLPGRTRAGRQQEGRWASTVDFTPAAHAREQCGLHSWSLRL